MCCVKKRSGCMQHAQRGRFELTGAAHGTHHRTHRQRPRGHPHPTGAVGKSLISPAQVCQTFHILVGSSTAKSSCCHEPVSRPCHVGLSWLSLRNGLLSASHHLKRQLGIGNMVTLHDFSADSLRSDDCTRSCCLAGESCTPLHVAAAGMPSRMPRSSALQAAACLQVPAAGVLWRLPVREAASTSCKSSYLAGTASLLVEG